MTGQELITSNRYIPIPDTKPGQIAEIRRSFRAQTYDCSSIAYFKMVDENGSLCFPDAHQLGLDVLVRVERDQEGFQDPTAVEGQMIRAVERAGAAVGETEDAVRKQRELLAAREQRLEAELALGHHAGVVSEADGLVREHPYREELRRYQAIALYRSGRQTEALDAVREARSALDDLGLEPTVNLRELERAILRHDPWLSAPSKGTASEVSARGGRRRWPAAAAAGGRRPHRSDRPRAGSFAPSRKRLIRPTSTPRRVSAAPRSISGF